MELDKSISSVGASVNRYSIQTIVRYEKSSYYDSLGYPSYNKIGHFKYLRFFFNVMMCNLYHKQ